MKQNPVSNQHFKIGWYSRRYMSRINENRNLRSKRIFDLGMVRSRYAVPTVYPAIPTTISVGDLVTCTTGTWNGTPSSFLYQWYQDASPLVGSNAASYSVQAAQLGHYLTCRIIAVNVNGNSDPINSNSVIVAASTGFTGSMDFTDPNNSQYLPFAEG